MINARYRISAPKSFAGCPPCHFMIIGHRVFCAIWHTVRLYPTSWQQARKLALDRLSNPQGAHRPKSIVAVRGGGCGNSLPHGEEIGGHESGLKAAGPRFNPQYLLLLLVDTNRSGLTCRPVCIDVCGRVGQCLAILGYGPGDVLNDFPGIQISGLHRMRVNSRIGTRMHSLARRALDGECRRKCVKRRRRSGLLPR